MRLFFLSTSSGQMAFAALGIAAILAAAVTATLLLGSGAASDEVALEGISNEQLLAAGISLTVPPPDFAPKVDEAPIAASSAIQSYNPKFDLPVKQMVLAHVTGTTLVPPVDRVLWVVSFDVAGLRMAAHGPIGSPPDFPYLYNLVFVDPDTGQVVYSDSAAGEPKE
jgi:hypothetical protein